MIKTGVSGHFSATHRGPNGKIHGHTWTVKAWFPAGPDALVLRQQLLDVLACFDHEQLPDALSRAEAMAETIGSSLPHCLSVEMAREADGLFAIWERD